MFKYVSYAKMPDLIFIPEVLKLCIVAYAAGIITGFVIDAVADAFRGLVNFSLGRRERRDE